MSPEEMAAEIAGMVSDEIGSRLRYSGDTGMPAAENFYPRGNKAHIDLEDGTRVTITVTVHGREQP